MNKTEQSVLNVLRTVLNNEQFIITGDEDWNAIYREFKSQSLLPVTFHKNRVVFEMHKRPGGTHLDGSEEQQELIQFFQDDLDSVEYVESCGYSIPVLPKCQNAMVLLVQ